MIETLLLVRALPDDAGETLQRHQRLAGPGPLLQLLDGDMIKRLPSGTAGKKRARNIHHMRRTRALIKQRRAAMRAKAARGFCGLVLEPRDIRFALDNAKALAPASDIGRIGRAMRAPARCRMIMPGPAGRDVDLETDFAAQALTGGDSDWFRVLCHSRFPSPPSLR